MRWRNPPLFAVVASGACVLAAACGNTETSLGAMNDPSGNGGQSGSVGAAGTSGGQSGGASSMPDAREDQASGSSGSGGNNGTGGTQGSGGDSDAGAAGGDGDVVDGGDANEFGDATDGGTDAGDAPDAACQPPATVDPSSTGPEGPSCAGATKCRGTSCCENILVPAGPFSMGRSLSGSDSVPDTTTNDLPEHTATVSAFYLDRFEVTVGRMRRYVAAYGTPPTAGAGAHPAIAGSGWQDAWNARLPATASALRSSFNCASGESTWTEAPIANERVAINCVDWYVAFAFCIWDGGRMPTEAEWEKVGAGAEQNRRYPWGAAEPEDCRASYNGTSPHREVGSFSEGVARWGHLDIGGGLWEWTVDWYDQNWYTAGGNTCTDCINLTPATWRTIRGAAWSTFVGTRLRSAYRSFVQPADRVSNLGFRCARSP